MNHALGKVYPEFLIKSKIDERTPPTETTHEVVQALERYVFDTGYEMTHLGLCSSDIVEFFIDRSCLRSHDILVSWLDIIIDRLSLLTDKYSETYTCGRSHLIPGSVTTVGYRLATTLEALRVLHREACSLDYSIRGFRGAMGNFAPLGKDKYDIINREMLSGLPQTQHKIDIQEACGQVPNREYQLRILQIWERVAMQLHKLASDIRVGFALGEYSVEKDGQASSSLIGKKANPIYAERVCSLSRLIPSYTRAVWDAGAHSIFERTLDDSAILRVTYESAFHHMAQILKDSEKMLDRFSVVPARFDELHEDAFLELQACDEGLNTFSRSKGQEKARREPRRYSEEEIKHRLAPTVSAINNIMKI